MELIVADPVAAGDFTAVVVQADSEADAIKVTLSVIYNNLSDPEWWKHKKEKVAAVYTLRKGDTVLSGELEKFGIEPFEIRAADATPVVVRLDEGPRIINMTTALEVVRLDRYLDSYDLWLKNTSGKNISAYWVSSGQVHSGSSAVGGVVIQSGATVEERIQTERSVEMSGITISGVVFEDGSFEGDPILAAKVLSQAEGVRIQAPLVLRRIKQVLEVEDDELQAAFGKLEADLWLIPEAISKQSAVEELKARYPGFDEKTIAALYEQLKGGLYQARNIALSSMGQALREMQESDQLKGSARIDFLRGVLISTKEVLEKFK